MVYESISRTATPLVVVQCDEKIARVRIGFALMQLKEKLPDTRAAVPGELGALA